MKFKADVLAWDLKEKRLMEESMTLRELSDKIDVSPATLSRIENGGDKAIDITTFTRVAGWINKNPGRYFTKDINITTIAESDGKVVVKTKAKP